MLRDRAISAAVLVPVILGAVLVLGLWFLTYGLGEETGWRGYALPHLQSSRSATTATLVLALLWAGWHLPAFFYRDTYVAMGLLGFPMFAFSLLFAAMVFTWLYNATGGSVLLVIIFHACFNWLSVSEAGGRYAAPAQASGQKGVAGDRANRQGLA